MGNKSRQATETEWRIIGVSGETVDGRQISAKELEEMAAQYDPEIYGARINLEHFKFLFPQWDGGYGDVMALKTEPWEKDRSKTALLAKLSVLPALQELWDEGQKIYSSMEIMSNFADTGKAYLVGLAITDTPASLGTTANFSTAAKQAETTGTIFTNYRISETQEVENMSADQNQKPAEKPLTEAAAEGLFARLMAKFTAKEEPKTEAAEQPKEVETDGQKDEKPENQDYAAQIEALQKEYAAAAKFGELMADKYAEQGKELAQLKEDFAALKDKLEKEAFSGERKAHTGGSGAEVGW
ncbi:GPO family capsid scaffolding protein [Neisseria dumasiana]|uniref:Phage capsid protein n=1 Tax=Neisseria dumasiana TaxID=1931275 RepID=A0A1X3DKA2_9NEIS|nr:GPO family capsid scaffolding protein [Neisseria dumasiana]OSI24619.1 hypothetical protein BV912_01840 [Neisseria dumasiana]